MVFARPALTSLTIEEKIGQMIVAGFPEREIRGSGLAAAMPSLPIGNFILFARNLGSPEELFGLNAELRRLAAEPHGIPPLVAVDQEGGVVTRIQSGATYFPGAMASSAAGSIDDIRAIGLAMGEELLALGFSVDFAPVADVASDPANHAIGPRSYGSDPARVAACSAAFAAGLARAGILGCAKHFPGHGDTAVDSHVGLPSIPHGRERLEEVDLVPFRRLLAEGIPLVMCAHVLFPGLAGAGGAAAAGLPASLSPELVTGLLRRELGFGGLVVTDCLEMAAITGGYPEAALLAVQAGADLLCISHTLAVQERAHASLVEALRRGLIPESRIDESVARILDAKSRAAEPPASWGEAAPSVGSDAHRELAARVSAASLALVRNEGLFPLRSPALYVDVEPFAATGAEDTRGRASVSAALESAVPGLVGTIRVGRDPGPGELPRILAAAAGRDIVVGTCDAAFRPSQLALARAIAAGARAAGRRCGMVAMRSPHDAGLLPEIGSAVCAFEYTPLSAASVADFLMGRIQAKGTVP